MTKRNKPKQPSTTDQQDDAPTIRFHEAPRFNVDDEDCAWEQYLHDNGYVVLANVLDQTQIDTAKDLLWSVCVLSLVCCVVTTM
jgi:hypothetical protein